jgi:hypothetical protein
VQLDHLFVMTAPGAPEADALAGHGFVEGAPNTHPGQGTANRRFFFGNAYLEFLWVVDEAEARSELVARTRLFERWQGRDSGTSSPFGVGIRPGTPGEQPLFRTWNYRPPYLPDGGAIPMATNSERLDEPLLFVLPFGRRPESPGTSREVTRVVIETPVAAPSGEAIALAHSRIVEWRRAAAHGMLIEFDRAAAGGAVDLRPALPLQLRW